MNKLNGDKQGMIIFNPKKWWSKWKNNEQIKNNDFQSLAGWDEHNPIGLQYYIISYHIILYYIVLY